MWARKAMADHAMDKINVPIALSAFRNKRQTSIKFSSTAYIEGEAHKIPSPMLLALLQPGALFMTTAGSSRLRPWNTEGAVGAMRRVANKRLAVKRRVALYPVVMNTAPGAVVFLTAE